MMKKCKEAFKDAGTTATVVMFMMFMVMILSWLYILLDMPNKMVNMISCMADSKIVILPMVNLFMVIIGMLMDDNSGTLLCGPILLPLVVSHAISLMQIVSPLCFSSKLTHIIFVKRRLTFSIETSIAFL